MDYWNTPITLAPSFTTPKPPLERAEIFDTSLVLRGYRTKVYTPISLLQPHPVKFNDSITGLRGI